MSSKIWALCQMFFMIFNRKGCWFFCGCTHHVLLSCRSLYSSISWDTSVSCSVHSPSFECAANASRNPESLLLLLLFCLCCCFQFVLLFSVLFFFFFVLLICCSTRCPLSLALSVRVALVTRRLSLWAVFYLRLSSILPSVLFNFH